MKYECFGNYDVQYLYVFDASGKVIYSHTYDDMAHLLRDMEALEAGADVTDWAGNALDLDVPLPDGTPKFEDCTDNFPTGDWITIDYLREYMARD